MNTQTEEWRPIKGYENYMVSSFGRVKSLNFNHTGKEKIKVQTPQRNGYMQVVLTNNGINKKKYVHRLVAEAFIQNPDSEHLTTINHIDYDKTNNKVSNLEWMTNKDNVTYSQGKKIKCYDIITKELLYYPSVMEASRQLNIIDQTIRDSIKNGSSLCKKRYIFSEI